MIPVSLAVWLTLEIVGFALLYHPGLLADGFDVPAGSEPGLVLALYTSIVTLSTLGYGDVTPTAPLFQALTGLEALIGFALLTLTISYVLNVYSVLQHLSLLGAELQQQPADPADSQGLLAAHLTSPLRALGSSAHGWTRSENDCCSTTRGCGATRSSTTSAVERQPARFPP
jgi:hypothetical protein